jgi:NIPSNAP
VSGRGAVVDLRTYRLKPGGAEAFDRILRHDALPMLTRSGIDVAAYGPSLDDPTLYYLVRSFASAKERNERLDAFYGSEAWRRDYRERVLALIDGYHALLLPAPSLHAKG